MNREEADKFIREWGDWAKWSDAREMVQAAYGRGYATGVEQGKKDALAANGVVVVDGAQQVLRDLTTLASEATDHTPDSFRRAVQALAQRARGVPGLDGGQT